MKLEFNLWKKIKESNNYSDKDMRKIRYVYNAIFSDFSKILIMGIVFFSLNHFPEYVGSIIVLMFIRTNSGGLHFEHYIPCLLFSFLLIFCSSVLLPNLIFVDRLLIILDLIGCICISFLLEPIRCVYRPAPGKDLIKICHINTFKYIFIFLIISYVLPTNSVIISGFWTINLQMLQLIAANVLERRGYP